MTPATELVAKPRFQGRTVSAGLPVRPRPIGGPWDVWQTTDGRTAIVARSVIEVIRHVEHEESPRETGGILFGRGFRDGGGEYVLVTHAERPLPGEVVGTVSTVAITAEGATAMSGRALLAQPVADVVGWYHTHPSYAAYFSPVDRTEQSRWPTSLAVGLVMSGLEDAAPRYAVFLGPESAVTQTAGAPRFAMARPPSEQVSAPAAQPSSAAESVASEPTRSEAPIASEPVVWLPPRGTVARRRLISGLALIALVLVQFMVIAWLLLPAGSDPSRSAEPGSSLTTRISGPPSPSLLRQPRP